MGCADAFQLMLELVRQGSCDDAAKGPRHKLLPDEDLLEHLFAHAESIGRNGLANVDRDSGLLEAAHVAVRGIQILQRAIERGQM